MAALISVCREVTVVNCQLKEMRGPENVMFGSLHVMETYIRRKERSDGLLFDGLKCKAGVTGV